MKKKETLCMRCGCDMTFRENFIGSGYCYVCAPIYSPVYSVRRRDDEEAREAAE